ncbi:synaptic vesicle 2-related protein-like isoform X2 [Lytechinus pictus]|uniref:synaptic vesicle 2-related protein-like isoform X2 n=1 Tax=Lytechinus pictus TaxID=7653 RepID=UPI0030BA14D3
MDEIELSDFKYSHLDDDRKEAIENGHLESEHACLLDSENDDEKEYTVEEAIDALGFGWFQIRTASIVGFHSMADAFEIMLVSVLSNKLKCEWRLSSWQQALFTTVVFGGYFLSAPLWGLIADRLGRRSTLGLCSFYIFYFGALSSLSPNYLWLLFLRGLVGFGLGGASQGVTILAEFLPSKTRGLCIAFLSVFWVTGVCLQVVLSLIVMPWLGWRYLMFFSSFPLFFFFLLLKKPKGKLAELFKTRDFTVSTFILLLIWFSMAFLYYGMVLMATELFSSGNTCASEPEAAIECFAACRSLDKKGYLQILVTSLAEYPGSIMTFIIIEWFGRRKTMSFELLIGSIFSFLLFLCTSSNIQMIFIFVVRAMIAGSFQTLYVYTPEVYPTHVRALSLGVCVSSSRIGAILTPFVAQVMIKTSVLTAIGVYASFCLLSCLVSLFLPIETKGKILK